MGRARSARFRGTRDDERSGRLIVGLSTTGPAAWIRDLERLWIDPEAPDVRDGAVTPLLALWLGEPELLIAFAGERASMVRRHEVLGVLSGPRFRALLREAAAAHQTTPEEAKRLAHFDALMGARHVLAPPPPETHARVRGMAGQALELAVADLAESDPWRESWEVQRLGLFGSPPLVAHTFQRATVLAALAACGAHQARAVRALIDEADPELRYYGRWRGIPPDADDVAVFLRLAARAPKDLRRRAEPWIARVLENARDGVVPTWLARGARIAGGPPEWPGDACTTVRARLLTALLRFDADRFRDLVERGAASLLAAPGEGAYHSTRAACASAFLELAAAYQGPLEDRMAGAASALAEELLAAQRLDGGWGSPLTTAEHLAGLATLSARRPRGDPLPLIRGMRYLREHQRPDGSWPAEDQYPIPLPDRRVGWHGGRAMTTARCAEALAIALRATEPAEAEGSPP